MGVQKENTMEWYMLETANPEDIGNYEPLWIYYTYKVFLEFWKWDSDI